MGFLLVDQVVHRNGPGLEPGIHGRFDRLLLGWLAGRQADQ